MANGNTITSYPQMLQDPSAYGAFTSTTHPYPLAPVLHGSAAAAVGGDATGMITFTDGFTTTNSHRVPQRNASMTPRSDDSTANASPALNNAQNSSETKARLRKACDSCSIRKVKCDEEGPPCRACAALDIPCTFERPSRRRGPPNRHAEAIKKRRFEEQQTAAAVASNIYSLPNSPTNAAHALASFSQQQVLTAESICPLSLLYPLVDDYFTYIHPLIPIPHEPTFREALRRRDDLHDPTFLSLLAAMIGCLVISFPRKPRLHLKAQNKESEFPKSMNLVDRCHRVAIEARGSGFLDKNLHAYDAAVSYFLGLTAAYGYRWRQCKLYFGECLSVLRSLGLHKAPSAGSPNGSPLRGPVDASGKVDYIAQEMGRRTFWVLFVGVKSLHQLGASYTELFIPPETPSDPYPPLPAEVDDDYIFQDRILPQPSGVIAGTVGFNANIKVFCSYNALATIDMAYGIDNCVDWERQKAIVKYCLNKCKNCLTDLPRELQLRPRHPSGDFGSSMYDLKVEEENHAMYMNGFQANLRAPEGSIQHRRNIQYEIQKANIYITQLGTRSHIVEKYWALCERHQRKQSPSMNGLPNGMGHRHPSQSPNGMHPQTPTSMGGSQGMQHITSHPQSHSNGMANGHSNQSFGHMNGTPTSVPNSPHIGNEALEMALRTAGAGPFEVDENEMAQEREDIVRDLLIVLGTISQVNMEPNGGSLIHKIRQIASTLLDVPRPRKGALALSAEQCLSTFLEVLMKLERTGEPRSSAQGSETGGGSPTGSSAGGMGMSGLDQHGLGQSPEDEEGELRHWADVREYQNRFAQAGGILSAL